jgi:hypothetical protein
MIDDGPRCGEKGQCECWDGCGACHGCGRWLGDEPERIKVVGADSDNTITLTPEKRTNEDTITVLANDANQWFTEIQHMIDRITAALGLPNDTEPSAIADAVRQCTRRCEALERKVIELEDARK